MITTKEHVYVNLTEKFAAGVIFTLQEVYDLCLKHNRIDELYAGKNEEEIIRAALQRLEFDELIKFYCRDSHDLQDPYCLLETKDQINPNQNIFDLAELENTVVGMKLRQELLLIGGQSSIKMRLCLIVLRGF